MSTAGFVVICGLPKSGNLLVHGLLVHHGMSRKRMRVVHYGSERHWDYARAKAEEHGGELRAIIMLRDIEANARSQVAGGIANYDTTEESHAAHWRPTLEAAVGCVMLPVRYEDIVSDPVAWGTLIVEFISCGPWKGWHQKIYDGNKKYRESVSPEEVKG